MSYPPSEYGPDPKSSPDFADCDKSHDARKACGQRARENVVEITAHGLRHSAATILLNHVEKYAIVLRGSLSESRITSEPAILRKIASPSTRGLPRDPQRRQRSPDNAKRLDHD